MMRIRHAAIGNTVRVDGIEYKVTGRHETGMILQHPGCGNLWAQDDDACELVPNNHLRHALIQKAKSTWLEIGADALAGEDEMDGATIRVMVADRVEHKSWFHLSGDDRDSILLAAFPEGTTYCV